MIIGNIQEVSKEIIEAKSIVIFHHIRPDGDCLGSQFGLKTLLQENYPDKKVYVVGNSNGIFSEFMTFEFDNDKINDEVLKNSLGVVVDANHKERIQNRELLDANLFYKTVRIDHHPNDDDLDKCTRWVDSSYIAAAEMIAHLAKENNWKVSEKAANYVFLGMVTDSGRFQYDNTSQRTHELAAFLYANNLNAETIFRGLATTTLADIELNKLILNNMVFGKQVVYTKITLEETKKLGFKPNDVVRPNTIGNIKGYPFWVMFNEEENGNIRVEYRSNGPCVRNVAVKWGGGGHVRASGSILTTFDDVDKVIADCEAEVERFQKEGN